MKNNKKFTLDNNTSASNPGEITFNPRVWIKYNFLTVFALALAFIVFILLSVKVSLAFLVFSLIALAFNIYYWISSIEHFTADSNPAMVVCINPYLAAVYTNLAKYNDDYYPAIKIIHFRTQKPMPLGQKIATVATYSEGYSEDLDYWVNFYPIPIHYATNNTIEINQALSRYSDSQWKILEQGIQHIQQPYKVGLYKLDQQGCNWSESD